MVTEDTSKNELQNIAPRLASLPKVRRDVAAPEGYFGGLPDSIFERIAAEDNVDTVATGGKVVSFRFLPWMAAASVLLVIGMSVWMWRGTQPQAVSLADFSDIERSELLAYVGSNIHEFDEDVLSESYAPVAESTTSPDNSSAPPITVTPDTTAKILSETPSDEDLEILLEEFEEEDLL